MRGGPEESTTGFYLTGRTGRVRAGQHLAAWMTDPGPRGLAIVTGGPGTGKSALLALPVLLTQPALRADLLRGAEPTSLVQRTADLLPPDTPIVAVHARGLNTDQAACAIAQALGRAARTAAALVDDLNATRNPPAGSWPWTPSTRRPRQTRCWTACCARWPASPACEWPWQPAGTCCPGSARQT